MRRSRPKRRAARVVELALILVAATLTVSRAGGQVVQVGGGNRLPGPDYYLALRSYYEGEFRRAADDFVAGGRSAFQAGTARFLDSACYWTMQGECLFQTGNYARALAQYEAAIGLYLDYTRNNWQGRIQQPPVINAANGAIQRAQVTWYAPRRAVVVPGLPDSMQMMLGNLFNESVLVTGGVMANPEFRQVDVVEIMRTTAIALQRRRWIKGSLCPLDSSSKRIVDALGKAGMGDASLLARCNQVLYGLALAGNGALDRARDTLGGALQFGAGMDHPLTGIALLELARIAREQGDDARASEFALEASFVAAVFGQYDIVEQSLALGTEIHLMTNRSVWSPLQPAIAWAGRDRARSLQVQLAVRQADCLAEAGNIPASMTMLDDAERVAARSDILRGPVAGRIAWLRAVNLFWAGNFDQGRQMLAQGLKAYAPGSRWLFQLGLVNSVVSSGQGVTPRQADALYQTLLSDPDEKLWRAEPVEAMSFLAAPHAGAIEAWLEIAIANRNLDRAIDIAELLRRHRYFAELPLYGRLDALRWLMHGPDAALDAPAMQLRKDFLTRVPEYEQLSSRSAQIVAELRGLPLRPEAGTDLANRQRDLFVELMKNSARQESMLASFALRREPASMGFPPPSDLSRMRSGMAPGSMVLYCITTASSCRTFEITPRGTRLLGEMRTQEVTSRINRIMRELGLAEKQLTLDQLRSTKWRETVLKFTGELLPGFQADWLAPDGELLIVPDGNTWNLPFEILLFGSEPGSARMLTELTGIRYSPTLALGQEPCRTWRLLQRTAIFHDRLDESLTPELTAASVARMVGELADPAEWPDRLMIPGSLLTAATDQIVVLGKPEPVSKSGPFGWLPVQKDVDRAGNNLAAWLGLPLECADSMVLPCFESRGAMGVRNPADGQDLFLVSLGLMATGARTVAISRWPTRGASTLLLTEEYLRRSKTESPVAALRGAQQAVRESKLTFADEPRVKAPPQPPVETCSHPLFWAGVMVMDIPTVNAPLWAAPRDQQDRPAGPAAGEAADPDKAAGGDEKSDEPAEAMPEVPPKGDGTENADGIQPDRDGGEPPDAGSGGSLGDGGAADGAVGPVKDGGGGAV